MENMLEVKNLSISFGGLRAVSEFDMNIGKGQLYGLIGPNGAGKTTIFNLLTGVYKPDEGIVKLDGQDITGQCKSRTAQSSSLQYARRDSASAALP